MDERARDPSATLAAATGGPFDRALAAPGRTP